MKFSPEGEVTYLSPVLQGLTAMAVGQRATGQQRIRLAEILASALEMAAGRKPETPLLRQLLTEEAGEPWQPPGEPVVVSFSGGVADCIASDHPDLAFGDLGPELGRAIREGSLCRGEYVLGSETIRATVIGAGCHSAQLSGSTVYHQNVEFPLKNLPVVKELDRKNFQQDGPAVLALEGIRSPSYRQVADLARQLAGQYRAPLLICLEQDMAKALGQALAARLPPEARILCIDRIRVEEGSYLDIGQPVGGALPVVVKTVIFSK